MLEVPGLVPMRGGGEELETGAQRGSRRGGESTGRPWVASC